MPINQELAKRYVEMSKIMLEYYTKRVKPPQYIVDYYIDALKMFRDDLNNNGFKIPSPLYRYRHDDVGTWMYLDTLINQDGYVGMVNNPQFKYAFR